MNSIPTADIECQVKILDNDLDIFPWFFPLFVCMFFWGVIATNQLVACLFILVACLFTNALLIWLFVAFRRLCLRELAVRKEIIEREAGA